MPGVAVFVYGTLCDPACVRRVTGRTFPMRPARLHGWVRRAPPGDWPYVVAHPAAVVDGFLLLDVDPAALHRLDAYEDEGRLYVRRAVEAVAGGERIACQVYARVAG